MNENLMLYSMSSEVNETTIDKRILAHLINCYFVHDFFFVFKFIQT